MKKTYYKITVLLLIPLIYYTIFTGFNTKYSETVSTENPGISNTQPPEGPSSPKNFINFILNPEYHNTHSIFDMEDHITQYNGSLKFNGVHLYNDSDGSTRLGTFADTLSQTQIDKVNELISLSHANNLKAVFERTKISRLCYGMRYVYEAEGENNGFSYNKRISTPISDGGRTVVKACASCPPSTSQNAGYLCNEIEENFHQSSFYFFRPYNEALGIWNLKPTLKIKQSDFSPTSTVPVVAIVTYNLLGHIIDSTVIKVRNFRTGSNYNGDYKNIFNFEDETTPPTLQISGAISPAGINESNYSGFHKEWSSFDVRIYWFGFIDVWFDKLVMDDEFANKLFAPFPNNYDNKINDELSHFSVSDTNAMDIFFVDECGYPHIPCVKYVQDYIRNYNSIHGTNAVLLYANSDWVNKEGFKNETNAYDHHLDSTKPDYFQVDAHVILSERDKPALIPSASFQTIDPLVPQSWYATNASYNAYFQRVMGDKIPHSSDPFPSSFIHQISQGRQQVSAKSPGTRYLVQPQLYAWLYGTTGGYNVGQREPTNEEINAQAWIALAHGADGICWFI